MNSRAKEIIESILLIFLLNYIWVFIHSYLNNYLLFRPISSDLSMPDSIFLWNTYLGLIAKIAKYALINSLSMSIVVLIIIFNKNADVRFQSLISLSIFVFNLIFSVLGYIIFKSIHISAYNLITYTLYFLIPWVLFLVIYNRYYISGFGHIVLYSIIFVFLFTIFIIMKNNSMVFKEEKYKRDVLAEEKNILKEELKEQPQQKSLGKMPKVTKQRPIPKPKEYPDIHIYPFKSGEIYYEISGKGMNATERVYFDHYGLREATITETKHDNGKIDKQMVLLDNNYIFLVDLNVKIGSIAISKLLKNIGKDADYNKILKYRLKQLEPVQTGMGFVMGKNCRIWASKDKKIKIWTWKGLILKKIIYNKDYPLMVSEAKNIKLNIDIPNEKFQIPKDIKFIRYMKAPKK